MKNVKPLLSLCGTLIRSTGDYSRDKLPSIGLAYMLLNPKQLPDKLNSMVEAIIKSYRGEGYNYKLLSSLRQGCKFEFNYKVFSLWHQIFELLSHVTEVTQLNLVAIKQINDDIASYVNDKKLLELEPEHQEILTQYLQCNNFSAIEPKTDIAALRLHINIITIRQFLDKHIRGYLAENKLILSLQNEEVVKQYIAANLEMSAAHLSDAQQGLLSILCKYNDMLKCNKNPLEKALRRCGEKEIQLLLALGADLEFKNKEGESVIMCAVRMHAWHMVGFLMSQGANLNAKDKKGDTALMHALKNSDWETLEMLVSLKADRSIADAGGDTPLLYAAYKGSVNGIDILTQGAKESSLLEAKNLQGSTPLMVAVKHQQWAVVEVLLSLKVNVQTRDNSGDTPLLYAAYVGDAKSIKLFVKEDVKVILEDQNKNGDTPLMCAIKRKHIKAFKALVCLGANINHANNVGDTPVKLAIYKACKGDLSYMQALKKYGSFEFKVSSESQMFKEIVTSKKPEGNVSLIDAIKNNQWDEVQALLFSDGTHAQVSNKKSFLTRHPKQISEKQLYVEQAQGGKKFISSTMLREHVSVYIQTLESGKAITGWRGCPLDVSQKVDQVYFDDKKQAFILKKCFKIGEGSFGKVYITQNVLTGKWYCMKIFKKAKRLHEQEVEILKAEGMYYAEHNTDVKKGSLFIGELVHGKNLGKKLESSKFSFEQALALIISLVEAYMSLHAKDYVHRDIKPANIIYDEEQAKCVAIDFGLSQKAGSDHKRAGTYKYMSLETLNDAPPQFKDDIYAIGLVAGEILSSRMHLTNGMSVVYSQEREAYIQAMVGKQMALGKESSIKKMHEKIAPVVLGALSSEYHKEQKLFEQEIALCQLIYNLTGPVKQRPENLRDILTILNQMRDSHIAQQMCNFSSENEYDTVLCILYKKKMLLTHAPLALDDADKFLLRAVDAELKTRPSVVEIEQYVENLDKVLKNKRGLNTIINSTPLFSLKKTEDRKPLYAVDKEEIKGLIESIERVKTGAFEIKTQSELNNTTRLTTINLSNNNLKDLGASEFAENITLHTLNISQHMTGERSLASCPKTSTASRPIHDYSRQPLRDYRMFD